MDAKVVGLKDRKYFREVLTTRQFSAGEFVTGRTTGRPVFHFAYPLLDEDGTVKAVIAASVMVDSYSTIFKRICMPPGSDVTVT
ncbi:MAG: hypothetical protein PHN75_06595 [Syntrophales bacterium]|nr:hypothetical protein [Syntrophales bacterium]